MMKKLLSYLTVIMGISLLNSTTAAQQAVFNKVYYNPEEGFYLLGSDRCADNGYILAGIKQNNSGHLIKTDSSANPEWARQINVAEFNFEIRDVICNPDSTIVSAGIVDASSDLLNIIKWDKGGDTLWSKNIEGLSYIEELRINRSYSGGYLITASNIAFKLHDDGELEWSKRYLSDDHLIYLSSIAELPGNNLIMCGYRLNKTTNVRNLIVIQTDENGNVVWAESLSESGAYTYSEAEDIAVTQDGIVLYSKYSGNYLYNGGLIKLEFDGYPVWAKNYALYVYQTWKNTRKNFTLTHDGGFAIVSSFGNEGQLMKTDQSGTPQWVQSIFMEAVNVVASNDHGYMVLGNGPVVGLKKVPDNIPQIGVYKTDSLGNGGDCIYPLIIQEEEFTTLFENFTVLASDFGNLAKITLSINDFQFLTEDTCVAYTGSIKDYQTMKETLKISPNPASTVISVESGLSLNPGSTLEIISASGSLIRKILYTNNPFPVSLTELPNGIYLLRLINNQQYLTGKLVVDHK